MLAEKNYFVFLHSEQQYLREKQLAYEDFIQTGFISGFSRGNRLYKLAKNCWYKGAIMNYLQGYLKKNRVRLSFLVPRQ